MSSTRSCQCPPHERCTCHRDCHPPTRPTITPPLDDTKGSLGSQTIMPNKADMPKIVSTAPLGPDGSMPDTDLQPERPLPDVTYEGELAVQREQQQAELEAQTLSPESFLCGVCGDRVPDTGRDDWSVDMCSDCHETQTLAPETTTLSGKDDEPDPNGPEPPYKPEPIGPPADWIPPYRPWPRPTPSSEETAERGRRDRELQAFEDASPLGQFRIAAKAFSREFFSALGRLVGWVFVGLMVVVWIGGVLVDDLYQRALKRYRNE